VIIANLRDLAAHLCAAHDTVESVARRIYKDTDCGACFTADEAKIVVSGYVEGIEGECPSHELAYPFDSETFEDALAECEREAAEIEAYGGVL